MSGIWIPRAERSIKNPSPVSAGILFTYTQSVVVSHNELHDFPCSGINSGYGWGANDEGGSDENANRGLYKYQPRYTTPTVAKDNQIVANLIHHGMLQMTDGGCHYNLSANPGTIFTLNYCNGAGSGPWVGDYEDEGSRYVTITKSVFASFGTWGTQEVVVGVAEKDEIRGALRQTRICGPCQHRWTFENPSSRARRPRSSRSAASTSTAKTRPAGPAAFARRRVK